MLGCDTQDDARPMGTERRLKPHCVPYRTCTLLPYCYARQATGESFASLTAPASRYHCDPSTRAAVIADVHKNAD